MLRSDVKAFGLTEEVHRKPGNLGEEEDSGTPCVAVECVDIWKNTSGEAAVWSATDAEVRKHG